MESSDDEKPEDSMMSNETQKAHDAVWNAGYRDGKDEGRKEGFQTGFDLGYKDAFRHSMMLGMFAGMIDALVTKDKTLKTFLEPVSKRVSAKIQERAALMQNTDESLTEADRSRHLEEVEQETTEFIGKLEEDFVKIFPYGEEEAKKILDLALKL